MFPIKGRKSFEILVSFVDIFVKKHFLSWTQNDTWKIYEKYDIEYTGGTNWIFLLPEIPEAISKIKFHHKLGRGRIFSQN